MGRWDGVKGHVRVNAMLDWTIFRRSGDCIYGV